MEIRCQLNSRWQQKGRRPTWMGRKRWACIIMCSADLCFWDAGQHSTHCTPPLWPLHIRKATETLQQALCQCLLRQSSPEGWASQGLYTVDYHHTPKVECLVGTHSAAAMASASSWMCMSLVDPGPFQKKPCPCRGHLCRGQSLYRPQEKLSLKPNPAPFLARFLPKGSPAALEFCISGRTDEPQPQPTWLQMWDSPYRVSICTNPQYPPTLLQGNAFCKNGPLEFSLRNGCPSWVQLNPPGIPAL